MQYRPPDMIMRPDMEWQSRSGASGRSFVLIVPSRQDCVPMQQTKGGKTVNTAPVLRLHQPIRVTAKYVRRSDKGRKFWQAIPIREMDCIFLGLRILSNGNRYFDSDSGWEYTPREWFAVALVAPMSASLNPFYVPPASIGILDEHIVKGSSK